MILSSSEEDPLEYLGFRASAAAIRTALWIDELGKAGVTRPPAVRLHLSAKLICTNSNAEESRIVSETTSPESYAEVSAGFVTFPSSLLRNNNNKSYFKKNN